MSVSVNVTHKMLENMVVHEFDTGVLFFFQLIALFFNVISFFFYLDLRYILGYLIAGI